MNAYKTYKEKARRELQKNVSWFNGIPTFMGYFKNSNGIISHVARRIREFAGHCWRSKDELVSDVLLWTPAYGQAKAGRPARTYIQQVCDDTGYNPEDLPEAINDRETWRERVRDIRAGRTT